MTFDITLDKAEGSPLFLQIATRLRASISGRTFAPRRTAAIIARAGRAAGDRTWDRRCGLRSAGGAKARSKCAARRGTIVSGQVGRRIEVPDQAPLVFPAKPTVPDTGPRPFQMGLPALDAFPRKLWSNLTVRAARSVQPVDLAEVGPTGVPELRHAVAAYLGGRARGIRCTPRAGADHRGISGRACPGAQRPDPPRRSGLARGPRLSHDPSSNGNRRRARRAGARWTPEGLRVAAGTVAAPKAKLAVVTPTPPVPNRRSVVAAATVGAVGLGGGSRIMDRGGRL